MKKLKLAALFAAVLFALGLYQFLQELKKPQQIPHTMAVAAAVDIPENTRITKEMVTLRSISNDSLPDHYMLDPESVIGMVVTGDIYVGELITGNRLIAVGETDSDRKTLAYTVTPGMRAVTIFTDQDTGLVNLLKPGNRVDVVASYTREEISPPSAEDTQSERVQVPTTQLLVQNVTLLAVGNSMDKNGATEYTTVTLEVTPQDAVNISAASWWGNLRLILRSPLDDELIYPDPADQKTIYAQVAGG